MRVVLKVRGMARGSLLPSLPRSGSLKIILDAKAAGDEIEEEFFIT